MDRSFVRKEEDDMIDITSAELKMTEIHNQLWKDDAFIRAPQTPSPMLVRVP